MTAALALAEVVVARGHVGTEADTLARALLVSDAWRAFLEADIAFRDELDKGNSHDPDLADSHRAAKHAARARLEALGEKP